MHWVFKKQGMILKIDLRVVTIVIMYLLIAQVITKNS